MKLSLFLASTALALLISPFAQAASYKAGTAKVDITDRTGPVNDPLFAKALAIGDGNSTVVIVTVDAVATEEIGRLKKDFLPNVRARVAKDLSILPSHVLVNASHCHGVVSPDVENLTVKAIKKAVGSMVPVKIGAGTGRESRIMENRRLKMKDGTEIDMRRAYSLPPDDQVAAVGPVDPEIGLLKIERLDGRPFAVLYQFACHPIHGVPGNGNTADYPGFASKAIEETLGEGVVAFFIQGCAGDINPIAYKNAHVVHDTEPLGNMLGLSVLKAIRSIKTKESGELKLLTEVIPLPRSSDYDHRIETNLADQQAALRDLKPITLNFKSFLPLYLGQKLNGDFPSADANRYLHEKGMGRDGLEKLDAENKANVEQYLKNIHVMEHLTRLQTNLALLRMHKAQTVAAGSKTIDVEVCGLKIGDFTLVTFPGELTVEIGLSIKKAAPRPLTFVAGYTNGYIYYTPTETQRLNKGYAQEDCDCLVAPEWRKLFETKVAEILRRL